MSQLGIDLGTTNTVLAIGGKAVVLPSESTQLLPSVVAYPPNNTVLVGTAAKRRRAIDAVNTISSSKRVIGRRWGTPELEDFARRFPFELRERHGSPTFVTRQGPREPEDVAAVILGFAVAELGLDLATLRARIAVPAGFGDTHRAATREAARRAGLTTVDLIDEPLATSRAYADQRGRAAVYDLGGGTFELAIVDLDDGDDGPRVVGMASDLYLGGDDVDRALAAELAERVLAGRRWDLRDDPVVFDRLVLAAEAAKVDLATAERASIDLSAVDPAVPGPKEPLELTRDALEAIAEPIIRRSFILCDEALAAAGVAASDIDVVLLAGGSCQMPLVRRTVASYFGREPTSVIDPMHVVAIGACD